MPCPGKGFNGLRTSLKAKIYSLLPMAKLSVELNQSNFNVWNFKGINISLKEKENSF
jgi:hypothetical protein